MADFLQKIFIWARYLRDMPGGVLAYVFSIVGKKGE